MESTKYIKNSKNIIKVTVIAMKMMVIGEKNLFCTLHNKGKIKQNQSIGNEAERTHSQSHK